MELKEKRILITGGTGFLGANLTHHLVKSRGLSPENIRIFYLENTSTIALEDLPTLELIPGNILDKGSIERACKGIDIIFHTVGNTSFEPRAKKIQWLINVEGTRNLLEVIKDSNSIEKCVYTSTVNTLGVPDPVGSIGTLETSNPYTNKPKLHSFNSPEEIFFYVILQT